MRQVKSRTAAEEIMVVHNALVRAFDVLDDTDAINRIPALKRLAQDIADLADRSKTLSVRYQKEVN